MDVPEITLDTDTALGLDDSSLHFHVDSDRKNADMPRWFGKTEAKLARE